LPDSPEAGQFPVEILADLDGCRDQHGAETGWIVDQQLRPAGPGGGPNMHGHPPSITVMPRYSET